MSETITIRIVPSVVCPNGHTELDPATANPDGSYKTGARFQIRAFKVDHSDRSWSECLLCRRWFSDRGEWEGETLS